MRKQAKWFRSATMMAFLAVVALFISPVLALGCCCSSIPHNFSDASVTQAIPIQLESQAQNEHICCDEEGKTPQVKASPTFENPLLDCAVVEKVCDCESTTSDLPFTTSDNAQFSSFVPVVATIPSSSSTFSFQESVRSAVYDHYAARPRSPDRTTATGRAPPALDLS